MVEFPASVSSAQCMQRAPIHARHGGGQVRTRRKRRHRPVVARDDPRRQPTGPRSTIRGEIGGRSAPPSAITHPASSAAAGARHAFRAEIPDRLSSRNACVGAGGIYPPQVGFPRRCGNSANSTHLHFPSFLPARRSPDDASVVLELRWEICTEPLAVPDNAPPRQFDGSPGELIRENKKAGGTPKRAAGLGESDQKPVWTENVKRLASLSSCRTSAA